MHRDRSMNRMTFGFAFLVLWLLAWIRLPAAQASTFYLHAWESHATPAGQWTLEPTAQVYVSRTNYDASGLLVIPSGLTLHSRVQGDLALGFGFWDRFTLFGRLSFARVQTDGTVRPGSNTGFADQQLGLNVRLFEINTPGLFGGLRVELQGQAEGPLYSNAAAESVLAPYLGDGTFDFTGGAFLVWPVWRPGDNQLILQGGAGYTYRTNGLSQALPWSARVEFAPNRSGITASASVAGYQSLQTDARLGVVNPSTAALGTSGLFVSNAIDPTLITLRGSAGYRIARDLSVQAVGSMPIYGLLAPSGMTFGVSLQARLGEPDSASHRPATRTDYSKSNKGFVRYNLEARVLRTNDRLNLLKVDKGLNDGVEVGQIFDIFSVRPDGRPGEAVARAKVSSVRSSESALEVDEYYREIWIEEGFTARRLVPE